MVAVTVQDADDGDTATSVDTLIEAAQQVETVVTDGEIQEVVADKGYHSNRVTSRHSPVRAAATAVRYAAPSASMSARHPRQR